MTAARTDTANDAPQVCMCGKQHRRPEGST